jgi:hypothetical protein
MVVVVVVVLFFSSSMQTGREELLDRADSKNIGSEFCEKIRKTVSRNLMQ